LKKEQAFRKGSSYYDANVTLCDSIGIILGNLFGIDEYDLFKVIV